MNDIGIRLYHDQHQWEVWIGPKSDLGDDNVINAFILGIGQSQEEALSNAVYELAAVTCRIVDRLLREKLSSSTSTETGDR